MGQYLVDTNLLVDYLRGEKKIVSFLDSLGEVAVSLVSAGEIYQGAKDRKELNLITSFLSAHCKIIPCDEQISNLALGLLEKYTLSHGLLILDALIAATAMRYDLTLVTGNLKHFRMIKGLKMQSLPG